MSRHNSIYAAFLSVRDAERAAGALLDHGVRAASVSFIVPHGVEAPPIVAGTPHMPGAVPVSPGYLPADLPVPNVGAPAPAPTASIDLNTGARVGEDVSVTHTAPGYHYDALGDEIPDTRTTVPTTYTPPADRYDRDSNKYALALAPGCGADRHTGDGGRRADRCCGSRSCSYTGHATRRTSRRKRHYHDDRAGCRKGRCGRRGHRPGSGRAVGIGGNRDSGRGVGGGRGSARGGACGGDRSGGRSSRGRVRLPRRPGPAPARHAATANAPGNGPSRPERSPVRRPPGNRSDPTAGKVRRDLGTGVLVPDLDSFDCVCFPKETS